MRRRDRGSHFERARIRVEELGLRVRIQERVVLVLSVNRHEAVAQLAQLPRRRCPTINPSSAPLAKLALQDELRSTRIEDRFDGGALRAAADLVSAATRAEREAQRVDDQRLAAPRLSGEQVEAWPEAHG
jgi:hypothetical protein